jgi:hypothetical protein
VDLLTDELALLSEMIYIKKSWKENAHTKFIQIALLVRIPLIGNAVLAAESLRGRQACSITLAATTLTSSPGFS